MHIICPGWFGNDHGPVVIRVHPSEGPPSHGICHACQRIANALLTNLVQDPVLRSPTTLGNGGGEADE